MASQQAWDDFESAKSLVATLNAEIVGGLKGYLGALNSLFTAIAADPARSTEVIGLADTHPVINSAYLSEQIGKLLVLRAWLIDNDYITL